MQVLGPINAKSSLSEERRMGSIGMGAVSRKGHPSFVQRASKFRAKGIFTSGYALRMCKLLHRSVRRHGGTSSARRRSFIRGVEKFRISSPALQLHKRTSSARRRSFRRGGGETQRIFIDNERRRCMYGGFQSVYGSFKNLRCSYYRMAFSQPRKGHAWIPTAVVVRAQQKCSTVHNRFSRYLLWYGSKYMIGRIRFLCMEVMVLK